MTDQTPHSEHPPKASTARVVVITTVIIFALAGATAAGVHFWQQYVAHTDNLGAQHSRIAEVEARVAATATQLESQLESQEDYFDAELDGIDRRLNQLAADLEDEDDAGDEVHAEVRAEVRLLSDSLANLRQAFGDNAEHWQRQEVVRLLQIANQQLRLVRDVESALNALQLAHEKLQQMPARELAPVRALVSEEISELNNLPPTDVAGTLRQLTALANAVHSLPLAGDPQTESVTVSNVERAEQSPSGNFLWDASKDFLTDLSELVQVEVDDDSVSPILSGEARRLVRQKADLILESCQLAFLRAQDDVYAARMAAVDNWVRENFDVDNAQVKRWLARLDRLATAAQNNPQANLPDISGSLRAMREVLNRN